jgi:type I restriction enzyme S subunit
VAKVDELMALCDRLEAQLQERDTRQAALARAALARFADAPTPANLELLFHDSFTITPADLRKTILTLAIQGHLVPQDPNDGVVASIVSASQTPQLSSADQTIPLPDHWQVARLADVAQEIVDCPHSTPKWTNQGKLCVRTSQFRPGRLDLANSRFVSENTFRERIQRLRPRGDDILYSREGGILGVACRVPRDVDICLGQRMMLIRAGDRLAPEFLEMVLNSPLITAIACNQTTGSAAPRINVATVRTFPIPIPPLAEQHRIVAKVDQLMALVDQWESQLAATRTTADHLLSALVTELTAQN